jgi:ABC-type multidrug transport system ATPase subunit
LLARQRDPVGTFSRGMVQRLTIARATLHKPDLLLLDEPYTGLDQEASALLDGLLRREAAAGRTILMITHDLGHGLNLCDRLVILYRGRIVHEVVSKEVSPAELYDLYAMYTGDHNSPGLKPAG